MADNNSLSKGKPMNILVGGEAGQGLATIGRLMSLALTRTGYEITVSQDYMSRVRGGHNTFAIRTGPEPVPGPSDEVDILVALNEETLNLHRHKLTERGLVLASDEFDLSGLNSLSIPLKDLAPKKIHRNVAALGVLGASICKNVAVLEELLHDTFKYKGDNVVADNVAVLRRAYEWVSDQNADLICLPSPGESPGKRIMVNGNEAIALGALASGCNFLSFYPMTPSTSIALTLIGKGAAMGLVSEQAEDEIAAVNMAMGAYNAGARAIVTTSGGGFALMTEGVSLAGITETPLVVALSQRPGPATGLPTRTEQGDLNLVLYAGHGEFPRAIFAPGDIEECFQLINNTFQQAEKYQTPAFLLTDQYLADSYRSVPPFAMSDLPELPPPLIKPDNPDSYRRYALSEDGISPRAIPGFSRALVKVDSDEHDETGHIVEDGETRLAQQDKRMAKERGMLDDVLPPTMIGPEAPDILMICWGSTLGPAVEAAHTLESRGVNAGVLHFSQVWPLREDMFMDVLESAEKVVCVEGNATGQFAAVLRSRTGFEAHGSVLRYDGRPFTAKYIVDGLADVL